MKKEKKSKMRGNQKKGESQSRAVPSDRGDHYADENQEDAVAPNNEAGDQVCVDSQQLHVSNLEGEGAQVDVEPHRDRVPLPRLIQPIVELWRRRQAWHRAEKSLTLQTKALCRRICGGDKGEAEKLYHAIIKNGEHPDKDTGTLAVAPLLAARDSIEPQRLQVEKQLARLVKDLPGYDFCVATPGLSPFTLYSLIGECPGVENQGFLDFATYQRVWKRFGLAVMPDGQRQRKVSGADALLHGYSPARRSVVWTIGDALLKTQGPYRELYLKMKAEEKAKAEAQGITVLPAAKIPAKDKEKYRSEGIVHLRAKRRMEKELLKDLWQEWRRTIGIMKSMGSLLAA